MFVTREIIKLNQDTLFLFGDNDLRRGLGGMAKEFRGEPNTYGIRTKKKPARDINSFYIDIEYAKNITKITEDLIDIYVLMDCTYSYLYIPEGIGSGLAKLDTKAPLTYESLKNKLHGLQLRYAGKICCFDALIKP